MFSVMIVDDELLVSIGIKSMVNWDEMEMRIVGEAQNGQDAYELYMREKPDLILTDIKMPVMDGLEFISKIRENDKRTKIVILTSYDEFDLVYKALKLGVSDYILKLKMLPKDIESVIGKLRDELKSESVSQMTKQDFFIDPSLMKEKLLKDYILYQTCAEKDFDALVKKMGLRLASSRMILSIMALDNYQDMHARFDAKHEQTVRQAILGFIDELLHKYRRGEVAFECEGRYWILLSFGDTQGNEDAKALLDELLDRVSVLMKTYINSSVRFGISGCYDGYANLCKMYAESLDALEQGYFLKENRLIRYGDDNKKSYLALLQDFRTFISQLDGIGEEYRKEILRGASLLAEMFGKPKTDVQEMLIRWIHWPSVNANAFRSDMSGIALDYAKRERDCIGLDEAIEVFEQYLLVMAQMQNPKNRMSREVFEATQFIKSNYSRDISLQMAAEKVGISAHYFSNLFKKETGISYIEYVNQVRIDKAKELLATTHLKTYEVALSVGFTDESYFSRVFKKTMGIRPYEFKKQPFGAETSQGKGND